MLTINKLKINQKLFYQKYNHKYDLLMYLLFTLFIYIFRVIFKFELISISWNIFRYLFNKK